MTARARSASPIAPPWPLPGTSSASATASWKRWSTSCARSRSSWRAAWMARRATSRSASTTIATASCAPRPFRRGLPAGTLATAERFGTELARGLDLVGLVALEMFVTRDGRVLANEMAPRPHNSGHWTIDACATSQFEQLVRAICGLPLGAGRGAGAVAHGEPDRRGSQRLAPLSRRPDGAAASLRQDLAPARPQDGSRHLLETVLVVPPVHDFTWAFSFSIFMTSSMRRSRKPQVASLPGERSFSQ